MRTGVPSKMNRRDEAFWKRQERRRERRLGQPCCTQSGMSWTMIDMPGNFAVVIHGEFDCVNCFTHHTGRSAVQYYSTRLTDGQLTTGETAEPLRRCLELIASEERPDAVIVLGTCPVEVIGDQFQHVVEEVAARTGVPMVALHTSGLRLSSQADMLDWCFDTLVGLGGVESAPATGGVNLLGYPPGPRSAEVRAALARHGVALRGTFPDRASMDAWRGMGRASHTFTTDTSMFPKLAGRLEGLGQQVVQTAMPIGLDGTLRFYGAMDDALGLGGALVADARGRSEAAARAVEAFRRDHAGKRLAVTLRMRQTYRSDVVAQDGLGQLAFFDELGLQIALVVQGAPDPEIYATYRAALDERGVTAPLAIFHAPHELERLLREGGYDLACVADHGMHMARAARVPAFDTISSEPFLAAVPANVARVRACAEEAR